MILWCRSCRSSFTMTIRLAYCPHCRRDADWSAESPEPLVPYKLTVDDVRWLQSDEMRIAVPLEDVPTVS